MADEEVAEGVEFAGTPFRGGGQIGLDEGELGEPFQGSPAASGAALPDQGQGSRRCGDPCCRPWCGRWPLWCRACSARTSPRRRLLRTSRWSRHSRRGVPTKRAGFWHSIGSFQSDARCLDRIQRYVNPDVIWPQRHYILRTWEAGQSIKIEDEIESRPDFISC